MTVCIFEGNADKTFGGAEKTMYEFSSFLNKEHNVVVICESLGSYLPISEKKYLKLKVSKPSSIQSYYQTFKNLFKTFGFIRKHKVDIIFTHTIHAFWFLRIVSIITRTPFLVHLKWIYNKGNISSINRWGLRGAKKIIALNSIVGNYWSTQVPNKKLLFCPDGISFQSIPPKTKERDVFQLLYFGRITHEKGVHLLLEAVKGLSKQFTLNIVGFFDPENNSFHKYLSDYCSEHKLHSVRFKGLSHDVNQYILEADLVVVPSILSDSQPLAILESIALKKNVIGSNIGGIPLIFNDNEIWIFEPNVDSLKSRIFDVMENTRKYSDEMEYLYSSTKKRFDKEVTQQKLIQIISNA